MDAGSCESWAKKSETSTSMDEDERVVVCHDPDGTQFGSGNAWATISDGHDTTNYARYVLPKAEPPRRSMPREAAVQPPWRVKSLKARKRILARLRGK